MDSLIGVLIFIVVVILSLASKAQEARKIAERQREKQNRKPQQLSEKARQQIHGRTQPKTATAREGSAPPPVPPARPVRKPKPVEQELLETLFGVKFNKEEDQETSREPQREPNVRQATQQMVQRLRGQSEPEPRRVQPRRAAPVHDGDEGPTVTVADIRAKEKDFQKQISALRARMHHGMQQGLGRTPSGAEKQTERQKVTQQRRPATKPAPPVRARFARGHRLFQNAEDVRRAIIVSEVLGSPKSMRNNDAA